MDTTTVGVDLAKNVFVACVADCAGRIVSRPKPTFGLRELERQVTESSGRTK